METDSGFSPTDDQKVAAYLFSNEVNKDLAPFRVKRIQGSLNTTQKNREIPAQLLKNFPLKTFPLSGYKKQKESRASQREEKRKSRKQKMEKMFRKLSKEKNK